MRRIYLLVLLFVSLLLLSTESQATHIMGADLTYTYVGRDASGHMKYHVVLSFYRDCLGNPLLPSTGLNVKSPCSGVNLAYTMVPATGPVEVAVLCGQFIANNQSACASPPGPYPGVLKFTDTITITLPDTCSKWIVSWTDGARNGSITNLQNPGAQSIYIESTINNTINPATGTNYIDDSPLFLEDPVPFVCLNSNCPVTYTNSAVDANGDSIVYTLVNPLTAANSAIPHTAGYTSINPITSSIGCHLDSTGLLTFQPTQLEIDVMTFLLQEYRNGVLIGSVMRDVQLRVYSCNSLCLPPPGPPVNISNGDTSNTGGRTIKMCPNSPSTFDLLMKDPGGRNLTLTSTINGIPSAIPGATFTQIGTGDSVYGRITWTPTPGDTGCHVFELKASTSDCPIPQHFVEVYTICVLNKVTVTPHVAIYCGTPIHLRATGGANASWTPTVGLSFPTGVYTPLAAPIVNTRYLFFSDCGTDTSLIIVNPTFTRSAGPGGTICQNDHVQLTATVDNLYAPYSVLWTPALGLTDPITHAPVDTILNPVASPPYTTTYVVQFTANTGCIRTDTVTVHVNGLAPSLHATANPTILCPGQSTQLTVVAQPSICGLAATPCNLPGTTVQVGIQSQLQGGTGFAYPSPYGNYAKSARHQFLIHKSELIALLGGGGEIKSLSMNIGTLNSGSTLTNFTIKLGCVGVDSLTGYVSEAALSTVYVGNYTPVSGWNTHVFSNQYNWDGSSNLVVDICFTNTTNGNINNKMRYSTTAYRSVWYSALNNTSGVCGITGATLTAPTYADFFKRPDMKFNVCVTDLSTANLLWTPNTGPGAAVTPTNDTTLAYPVATTTYTIHFLDTNGCTSSDYVTVFTSSAGSIKVSPDTFVCNVSPVKLHALVAGVDSTLLNYQWAVIGAGTAPPSGVGLAFANPTVTPSATTLYSCSVLLPGGCTLFDTARISLGTNLPIAKVVDSITCNGVSNGKVYINMNAGVAPYTYSWNPVAGNVDSIVNLGPGTYIVTVTDNIGCVGKDTTILVNPLNGLPVAKVVDSITCNGLSNGKIFINMAVGTAPYNYAWNPAAPNVDSNVNLAPGMYIVTVTDMIGCVGKDTTVLTNPAPIGILMDSTNVLCFGASTGTITATVSGGRAPFRYTWSPANNNTANLNSLGANLYAVTVTDTAGCTVAGQANVAQPTQVTSLIASTNLSGVGTHDGTITVTANGGTPNYTYTSVPTIAGLPNAAGLDTGLYIVTVCDAHNCCVQDTTYISVPPPIAVIPTKVHNKCKGYCTGSISVTCSGGIVPYRFKWSTNPATDTTNAISNLCAGPYTLTVTDSNGISVSNTYLITEPMAIRIKIDSTLVTCFGLTNGSLTDSAWGGTPFANAPFYTSTWNPGGTNPITNLGAGMYIVTVTDSNNCTLIDTAYLGQPTPVVAKMIDSIPAKCFGQSNGYAKVQASGGRPPYTYAWSGSSFTTDTANDLNASIHTVTVTDNAGCTATTSVTISQPLQIVVTVDSFAAHCGASHDGTALAHVSNGTAPYHYQWDGIAGAVNTTGLTEGQHTVMVTDTNGCSTSLSFHTDTLYILHITTAMTPVSCFGGTNGTATATMLNGSPVYQYSWMPSGAATNPATGLSAGLQNVTVTDMYGCQATDAITVTQPNQVIDTAHGTNPLCAGDQNGKVSITAGGGAGAPYTFTWIGVSHPITDVITGLSAGTYMFTVADVNGCTQTDSVTLIDPSALALTDEVGAITCANFSNGIIRIHAAGGTPAYTYTWTPNVSTDSMQLNLAPGHYSIVVSDAHGCSRTISETLVAPPPITLLSMQADSVSCPDSANGHIVIVVVGGTQGSITPYRYSLDNIHFQDNNNFYDLPAGTYRIYVSDSQSCEYDTVISVYAPLPVTATIEPYDTLIALGSSITLNTVITNFTTQPINSYSWVPTTGLSCNDCPTPIATPYQTTEYGLTINYGKNCIAHTGNHIALGPIADVYIPNAFTPNGDEINDQFSVFGTALRTVSMTVFNRWGEKVYDSGGSQWASWDGNYKGVAQPTGVYIYLVELTYLNDAKKTREGSITLIR